MSVTVNCLDAERILRNAIDQVVNCRGVYLPSSRYRDDIEQIILGTHLTYRYMLITGLVSKSTNTDCNPLALQVGSLLAGSYDARSICHRVIVPIERELLGERLGGSNEPFLNKPARYQEISSENPVRRGNDLILLNRLINVLGNLSTSEDAYLALTDCIYFIFQRSSRDVTSYLSGRAGSARQTELIEFALGLIDKSFEGETCALLVGATYSCYSNHFDVRVHKVNQAGSSSREILDVDVFYNGNIRYAIEVKDKPFTFDDVGHAVSKAVRAGCYSVIFAVGPRGRSLSGSWDKVTNYWAKQGVDLYFVDVLSHFISTISYLSIDAQDFVEIVNEHASNASVKDETLNHIISVINQLGW